jgi:hypothetical protein
MSETPTVPLYRIENPTIAANPNGVTSHEDLVGQWFTPRLDAATSYLRKSTQTFGKDAHPVEGAQLVVADVPADQVEALHVSRHPVASAMDVENDNYIVPRSGQFNTTTIPLDETVGDLRGQLGRVDKLQEARQRIAGLVAQHSDVLLK